jgi:hypothetical protein
MKSFDIYRDFPKDLVNEYGNTPFGMPCSILLAYEPKTNPFPANFSLFPASLSVHYCGF